MARIGVIIFAGALSVGVAFSAQAADFCDQLNGILSQEGGEKVAFALPNSTQVQCSVSLTLSGSLAHHCGWPFDFRAPEATTAFQSMLDGVTSCFGAGAVVSSDTGVNHPDTYDLQMFRTVAGTVSVSLKDKGALQQTYVFLRIEKTPAP